MKLKNKGFTLVELLAVIAILAILLILVTPNVLNLFAKGKRDSFITQVQSVMNSALDQASMSVLNTTYNKPPYCNNCGLQSNLINPSANALDYYVEINQETNAITQITVSNGKYCYSSTSPTLNAKTISDEMEEDKIISCDNASSVHCTCVQNN